MPEPPLALDDIRVLDFTTGIVGPFATKLLADLGADVIKVEPPAGDPARMFGPFPGDQPHPERSGVFLYLNNNKRGIVLDLETESGRGAALRLAATADLVVENFAPGRMASLGLDLAALETVNPQVVLHSITPFGQTGPYRDYLASPLVLEAMGQEMHSVGLADRPPLRQAGNATQYYAGAMAAVAALGAVTGAKRHGRGQWIDHSIFETHLYSIDRRSPALLGYAFTGRSTQRSAEDGETFPGGIFPCADGFVQIYSSASMWDRIVEMLGQPEALLDPKWSRPEAGRDPELVAEFMGIFYAWLYDRTKLEVWDAANEARVYCGPLNTVADLLGDEKVRARGVWAAVDHPEMGHVEFPGRPSILARTPWQMRRPAPLLGQHTDEVLATVAESRRTAQPPSANPPLPLAGVRVIDLCASWAGPIACELLADLGAEVIRVENPHMWQPMTRGHQAHPTKEGLASMQPWTGGYPDGEPGDRPWNRSPSAITCSRNKYSMSCDLRTAEGKGILARLVAVSDVVIENSVTETMEKLGVTYDWLTSIKPDIIYLRGPGFGNTGPRKNVRGVGVSMEAFIGHPLLRCYPDIGPMSLTAIYPSDALAGAYGAFNALAALHFRGKTGEGQLIETAQAEAAIGLLPEYVIDYVLNGRLHDSIANRDLYGRAPSGVYPCAGDDRWIAITIEDDNAWRRFVAVTGLDPLADLGFTANARRLAAHDQLDAAIAGWTATQERDALFLRLQAAGVAAGPVLNAADVYADPHVRARGFLLTVDHGSSGKREWPGLPFRYSGTPLGIRKPSPDMGEDNEYIYRTVLGYSAEEYARFRGSGQVTEDYDEDVP